MIFALWLAVAYIAAGTGLLFLARILFFEPSMHDRPWVDGLGESAGFMVCAWLFFLALTKLGG